MGGFLSALRAPAERGIGEEINVGSNFEISIGDTASLIADCMGVDIRIETDNERLRPATSEVERLWCDNSKAAELMDWRPEYAGHDGFARGLKETIEWFSCSENLVRYKHDIYNI